MRQRTGAVFSRMVARCAVAGLVFVGASMHAQKSIPPPELAEANRQFDAKHYTEAAALCRAIAKDPSDQQLGLAAQLLEAKSEIHLDHFATAGSLLDAYLAVRPQSAEALYLQGYVLERENKARESLAIFNRAAAVQTPQANDLKLVALDYVLLNDYADAVAWLKRSLAADPSNAEAWYFLGRASMQLGDFKAAESSFRESLRLNPGDAKALDNLGLTLEAENRNEDALAAYRQAVERPVGEGSAREQPFLDYGTLLNNENRSSEALPHLRRAVELAPHDVRCLDELSRAETAVGDLDAGLRALLLAVSLDSSNPRLHFRLSQLYRKAGQADKADKEARESVRLYGTHSTDSEH